MTGQMLDIPVALSRGFRVKHGMTECDMDMPCGVSLYDSTDLHRHPELDSGYRAWQGMADARYACCFEPWIPCQARNDRV
jgi:hypothetical protein